MFDVVILAAGVGSRTQLNYPKQLARLGGIPILIHIIKIIKELDGVDNIFIATIPNNMQQFRSLLGDYNYDDVVLIEGGSTRQESVYKSIQVCQSERVLLCEACRPFITNDFIKKLLTYNDPVVTSAKRINTTVYNENNSSFPDRNSLWDIQLPQLINTQLLIESHISAINNNRAYTDDTSLILGEMGIKPKIVEGLEMNFKITTPIDVKIAEAIYNEFNCNNWS